MRWLLVKRALHYLIKEDRSLRWLLVKHHNVKYGFDFLSEDDGKSEISKFRSNLFDEEDSDKEDDEYDVVQAERKNDPEV
ncbi:hypothetical protein RHGRI_000412 [Rhododendron griersonianum]|uniref:Uncharacterized protein n=1 Tax=Rhododendron griersonianum TaxID=479676 RepID=A0AAV6LGG9_9ERIC|nr:hypothetical protein RHGRI_000412 [Rhododendron griersonianum]